MRCSGRCSVLLALTLTTNIAGTAVAAEQNDPEFKGFHFGRTTLEEWKQAVQETGEKGLYIKQRNAKIAPYCAEDGNRMLASDRALGIETCSWYAPDSKTLDVGPADTTFEFWKFVDGVLASFTALSYPAQVPNLIAALKAKYGEPTAVLTPQFQNQFGAQFTNEVYMWNLGSMDITVTKYAGKLDTSGITIINPQLSEEIKKRKGQGVVNTKGL